jgi:hypothetical protein
MNETLRTKKALILDTAREIAATKWTPAEIEQLRRKLLAEHGEAGKTGPDYIAEVLNSAGWKKKRKRNTRKSSRICCISRRWKTPRSA